MPSGPNEDGQPADRYGAGLPRVDSRRLAGHEHESIRRRLRRLELGAASAVVALGGVAAIAATWIPRMERNVVAHLGGALGVGLAATGAVGLVTCLFAGRRAWRATAALGALYLLAVAGLEAATEASPPPPFVTWVVVFGLVVLGNGYLCVRGWQRARVLARRRRIHADLLEGRVERFAGAVPSRADETLRHLVELGDLRPVGNEPHRLELLPRSGLVLRVDGRPLRRLTTVHVANVAPAQPHAFRVALPPGLAPTTGPKVDMRRRSLSPAEREELATHIRRLRRRTWPVIAVTAAVVAVTATQLWEDLRWEALTDGVSLCWYALAAIAWAGYVRRIVAARKLEHDRELRWVVTVDEPTPPSGEPMPPKLEVLPISQLAWTENASPATWRVSRL